MTFACWAQTTAFSPAHDPGDTAQACQCDWSPNLATCLQLDIVEQMRHWFFEELGLQIHNVRCDYRCTLSRRSRVLPRAKKFGTHEKSRSLVSVILGVTGAQN